MCLHELPKNHVVRATETFDQHFIYQVGIKWRPVLKEGKVMKYVNLP